MKPELQVVYGNKNVEVQEKVFTLPDGHDYFYVIYCDKFGREWMLIPVENENIKFPFAVKPLKE